MNGGAGSGVWDLVVLVGDGRENVTALFDRSL